MEDVTATADIRCASIVAMMNNLGDGGWIW